ncbi:MAG: glycosyltransferase family 2 protein [Candidatus Eisenbacteria bacterium]|nr:glycosyltransferase family 2 protein [Candidatus Eisenbacteria bacterium]
MVREISIVFPAYNEEENVGESARRAVEAAEAAGISDFEILFVDDGSRDATAARVEALAAADPRIRLIRHPRNLGYAMALKTGFEAASKRYIFYSDSDNQFDMKEMKNFLPAIDDYDIVVGFRIYRFDPLTRLFLAWCYNLAARMIFRIRVRDIDCAFKLFRREVFDVITIESKKFFVDTEILAKAVRHKMRVTEIGVRHYPRPAGRSTVRASHVFSTIRELIQMWIKIYLRSDKPERPSSA